MDIYTKPMTKTGRQISVPEYTQEVMIRDKRGENTYTLTFPQCLTDLTEVQRKELLQYIIIDLTKQK